jgi:hypothetical protein
VKQKFPLIPAKAGTQAFLKPKRSTIKNLGPGLRRGERNKERARRHDSAAPPFFRQGEAYESFISTVFCSV